MCVCILKISNQVLSKRKKDDSNFVTFVSKLKALTFTTERNTVLTSNFHCFVSYILMALILKICAQHQKGPIGILTEVKGKFKSLFSVTP